MSRSRAAWGHYETWRRWKGHIETASTARRKGPKPYKTGNRHASWGFHGLTSCRCGQIIRCISSAVSNSLAVIAVAIILYFVACWISWIRANDQHVDGYLDREIAYRKAQSYWKP